MRERPREVVTMFGGAAVLWAGWFVLLEVTSTQNYSPHAARALDVAQQILFWTGFLLVATALLLLALVWWERWRSGEDAAYEPGQLVEPERDPEPPLEL